MIREHETIRLLREAVANAQLKEPFRAADVNKGVNITFAGVFLAKHRERNPDGNAELFVHVDRGLYRLK